MPLVRLARADSERCSEVKHGLNQIIEAFCDTLPREVDRAVIKVNLRYYWDYTTGETTNPIVVGALIDCLRERYDEELDIMVAEADATAMKTEHSFKMLGYMRLASEKGVALLDLSQDEVIDMETTVEGLKINLPIPKTMLTVPLVVNLSKMLPHTLVGFTASLKNLFGAIAEPRKIKYHSQIHHVIVAVNKIIKPSISIIDGIIVAKKNPMKLGLLMASTDSVALDSVAGYLLGVTRRPRYLKLAEKEGVGTTSNIVVEPRGILQHFIDEYKRLKNRMPPLFPLQMKVLKLYARIANDEIPPILLS